MTDEDSDVLLLLVDVFVKQEEGLHETHREVFCLLVELPARILWPSPTRQNELAKMVEAREPLLKHRFGFIDGKNVSVQQPSIADLQNVMYNGWLHSVFVTGTICFAADACIVWCKHNCPGPWNDSDTSLGFRTKLLDPVYCPDSRKNVVSDSAFPCSTMMVGRILTSLKDGDLERLLASVRRAARTLHNAITSVRQAAEWGVGRFQKVYARLNSPQTPSVPRAAQVSDVYKKKSRQKRRGGKYDEVTKQKKTCTRCSNCGIIGHWYGDCTVTTGKSLKPDLAEKLKLKGKKPATSFPGAVQSDRVVQQIGSTTTVNSPVYSPTTPASSTGGSPRHLQMQLGKRADHVRDARGPVQQRQFGESNRGTADNMQSAEHHRGPDYNQDRDRHGESHSMHKVDYMSVHRM
ncbi:Hypothetical protein PHPALM_36539 [Phytophthora palmivora]|uniref:DDE Tnp4 domain-containing protein n=1 Tax=Phytophthora palmivora TaxID=4796 RepID=A0A2P4WZP2_9STRA|nr:Hypothetical protein PHPALM_36539 [Phytophthora palmivora]